MKRVLCIVSSLNTGGAETFLMKLYRTFNRDSYQMDFVVNEAGIYDEEVKNLGGKIYTTPLRTKHPINSFLALKRIVKENKYEYVLKLCDTPKGYFDLLASKLGGADRVCVRSCNASANIGRTEKVIYSLIRPLFNQIADVKIAPSRLAAEFTFGKNEVEKGKVHLLHNAINLKEYKFSSDGRNMVRSEFGVNDEDVLIGHIGRFNKQKNHHFLIEVFDEFKKKNRSAKLMLVGAGELQSEIYQVVKKKNLENSVIFTGIRTDIPNLLSAMDTFVFPSLYEGMPNTVIEAQAAGLPCVISNRITREVKLTDLVNFCDIDSGCVDWADVIEGCIIDCRESKESELRKAGYDINTEVSRFTKLIFE